VVKITIRLRVPCVSYLTTSKNGHFIENDQMSSVEPGETTLQPAHLVKCFAENLPKHIQHQKKKKKDEKAVQDKRR